MAVLERAHPETFSVNLVSARMSYMAQPSWGTHDN